MPQLDSILPDFVDIEAVGRACAQAKFEANRLKDQIESFVAECVRAAYTNQSYWVNNKPPTQSYIENTVKIMGNTQEDVLKFRELNEAYREKWRVYEELKAQLDTMKDRISVFQTLSSNKRSGF